MKKGILALIKGYQKHIRHKPCCRFTPTCSAYAYEAVSEWGVIRGLGLAIWRVLRCNPLSKGGYDPVPLRRSGG
ncbi:MAG: membrane protein insertion efficiency factor YidD [Clostridiales bacterium]|nr:membrane protein insertion efficiency factor YidD [Clostridiales bacterium]